MTKTDELKQILEFIKLTEKLKDTLRTGKTSGGRTESVSDHTWRLCLMAVVFQDRFFPDVDFKKLIKICLIHDLGEAIGGDIPAPQQVGKASKSEKEKQDLQELLKPLPDELQEDLLSLWLEYEGASTEEAKLAKALDKMETIIQHNQGQNTADFDLMFNLDYGKKYAQYNELVASFRELVDADTRSLLEKKNRK